MKRLTGDYDYDYCSHAEVKLEELNPLPINHGDHGALSKEEAMERLEVKGGL